MSEIARRTPSSPELAAPLDDEGSTVRPREKAASEPIQRPGSTPSARAGKGRSISSTRPATPGSLDDRIEHKLRIATALMRDLPANDTRVRLLHIAVMRRDESLLDGVLSELNKPVTRG